MDINRVTANSSILDEGISTGAKLTYLALTEFAYGGFTSYPTKKRLAEKTSASERSVDKYIKELLDGGYIEVTKEKNNIPGARNTWEHNVYYLRFSAVVDDVVSADSAHANSADKYTGEQVISDKREYLCANSADTKTGKQKSLIPLASTPISEKQDGKTSVAAARAGRCDWRLVGWQALAEYYKEQHYAVLGAGLGWTQPKFKKLDWEHLQNFFEGVAAIVPIQSRADCLDEILAAYKGHPLVNPAYKSLLPWAAYGNDKNRYMALVQTGILEKVLAKYKPQAPKRKYRELETVADDYDCETF